MYAMKYIGFGVWQMGVACIFLSGMFLVSCSSAPESQPEPSKDQVQKDADRFFDKMNQEEKQSSYPE